jgi:hypothetical protein
MQAPKRAGGFISISVEGLTEINAKLERLPQRLRNRAARRGMTKAARILLREMKMNVPRESGALRRALKYVIKTPKRAGRATGYPYAILGPNKEHQTVTRRRGKWGKQTMRVRPAFYEHLVDGGARPHQIYNRNRKPMQKDILHPGVTPTNYRRRSIEAVRERCMSVLADEIQREINIMLAGRGLANL